MQILVLKIVGSIAKLTNLMKGTLGTMKVAKHNKF
jgi:hypothetical protein